MTTLINKKNNYQARLFLLPYSGVGASIYEKCQEYVSLPIQVVPIQLPGREERIQEKPYTQMPLLIEQLLAELKDLFDKPIILFGHCLGAFIAYELGLKLMRLGCKLVHFFVSACPAPHMHCINSPIYQLPSKQFLQKLQERSYFHSVQTTNSICKILLSGLRSDFTLYETYYRDNMESLDCPVTAMYGTDDDFVEKDKIMEWRRLTHAKFDSQSFLGDHLFIHKNLELIVKCIEDKVKSKINLRENIKFSMK